MRTYTLPKSCFIMQRIALYGYPFIALKKIPLFFFIWRNTTTPPPQWPLAPPFTRFLDHKEQRASIGKTPLDE